MSDLEFLPLLPETFVIIVGIAPLTDMLINGLDN